MGVALLVGTQVWGVPQAAAGDCDHAGEQVLFVRSNNFPSFGTESDITEADRTLAFDCQADAENHHTAHVRDSMFGSFAEAGYVEDWTVNSSHRFRIFWEVGIGSTTVGGFGSGSQISCCQTVRFRVVNVQTNNNWKFFFALGTNPLQQFGPSNGQDAGFHQAYPFAEVGRRGDPGTQATTNQDNLHRKVDRQCSTNCFNTSWSTNFVHNNTCIPKYEYVFVSNNHWKTRADPTHTC